jgi:hypothetical protein
MFLNAYIHFIRNCPNEHSFIIWGESFICRDPGGGFG